jgi:hypothetical protein
MDQDGFRLDAIVASARSPRLESGMRTTTYAYPWDLARLGVETTLDRIAGEGFDAVDLAATYHPIDALSPREGMHLFAEGRGAVYFPARTERYGRIKPRIYPASAIVEAWPRAAAHAAKIGLGLNSWTITLFQPWIRDLFPDTARLSPGGGAQGSGVCAANADVRAYLATLCADVAEQFGVGVLRLEAVLPYAWDFDWARPRVMVAMPPFARTLSNLCFCDACTARGAARGLDVARLRGTVNAAIGGAVQAGSDDRDDLARLTEDTELTAYAENHVRATIELVDAIGEAVGGRSVLATNVGNPYRSLLGESRDAALTRAFLDAVGQIDISPTDPAENRRVAALNAHRDRPHAMSTLCIVSRQQETVASAAQRVASRGANVRTIEDEADLGVREFTLYNYGLITDAEVGIFRAAIDRLAPAPDPA